MERRFNKTRGLKIQLKEKQRELNISFETSKTKKKFVKSTYSVLVNWFKRGIGKEQSKVT